MRFYRVEGAKGLLRDSHSVDQEQRESSTSDPQLKMFTRLLRIKWVANALTSMQTLSKHNSLMCTK